jgi:hypothetical protein
MTDRIQRRAEFGDRPQGRGRPKCADLCRTNGITEQTQYCSSDSVRETYREPSSSCRVETNVWTAHHRQPHYQDML